MSYSSTVVVVGLGNIGSWLVPQLVRATEVERLVLVDPDRYEADNIAVQNINAADVGLLKVDAMTRHCAEIRGEVEVEPRAAAVEDVPLGVLRGDVIACCVDSRAARQAINGIAWRLGVPMIDAAVQGENLLARVAVYQPEVGQPCLECRWGTEDYQRLESVYACGATSPVPGSGSPGELGALAAAYQTMALRRVLSGEMEFAGRELYVNAQHHTVLSAHFGRNPSCRFDHQTFRTGQPVDGGLSAAATVEDLMAAHAAESLAVTGHSFVFAAACSRCAQQRSITPQLSRGIDLDRCPQCGGEQKPAGFSMCESLPLRQQAPGRRLVEFGLCDGDVVTLTRQGAARTADTFHLQLGSTS